MIRRTLLAFTLLGCGPSVTLDPDGSSADGSTGGSTPPGPMTSPTTASTSTSTSATTVPPDPSTTTDPSTGSATDDGATFIDFETESDTVCLQSCECDVLYQDCGVDQKCTAWANDGGTLWNAVKCVEVDPDGAGPGEPCTMEGSAVSGVDDCDGTSMCWDVDPKTLQGVCVPFCVGTVAEPTCAKGTECMQANEGTVAVCVPSCDPLASTCADGEGCYLVDEAWSCLPIGVPVEFAGTLPAYCEPGSTSIPLGSQSYCDPESEVCCAAVCDVDQPTCAPPYQCTSVSLLGGNPGLCVD